MNQLSHTFQVEAENEAMRLDIFLTQRIPDVPSRNFVQSLIEGGFALVDGKIQKSNYKLTAGEEVTVNVPGDIRPPDDNIQAENIPLDVFYEDADIVVINKPIGMSVHPANQHETGTLAHALKYRYQELSDINGPARPGIVHRLDRETSGLIIVAKNNRAHARLARQFEKHTVHKRYVALVHGEVAFDEGRIDLNLARHQKHHDLQRVVHDGSGRSAVTIYKVLRRYEKVTLVALYPHTGRTHQLRVHMKHLGHPILGDDKYGHKGSFERLALHAQAIYFMHPATKFWIGFSGIVPKEFFL